MRCAVLGDPVEHSLSPVLHRAAYDALGLAGWTYDAVRVGSGSLESFVVALDRSWRGLSLTMPLKREVLPLLATQDAWVRATGACNTVVIEPDGSRHGANTDVTGAIRVLSGLSGPGEASEAPARAVVVGGGATATSVLVALAERGLTAATLVVRNPATVQETVDRVRGHHSAPALDVVVVEDWLTAPASADLVVSTVPATAQSPALVDSLAAVPAVFEVLYDPWPTPLAAAAAARGCRLATGLDLLVAQAVDQVVLMTGATDVPLAAMRAAAEDALAARA